MHYPEEVLEEVRSRNDIVEVIGSRIQLKRQGSNYFGLCPFHNEKSPSFSVSPSKQMFHCFGCGAGGNVISFVMQYENLTFPEAVTALAQRAGVSLPQEEESAQARGKRERRDRILEINRLAAVFYYRKLRSGEGSIGLRYLQERELSEETMRQFGLGYAGRDASELYRFLKKEGVEEELMRASGLMNFDEKRGMYDRFWNRVIFPIMDINNRVIGFGGRVMGDGKPKYLNSPETEIFDKSRNLYGLNIARKTRNREIIVCEGYMDVISMHQAGFTNSVASLGTALTLQHAAILRRYTEDVLLCYDSDDAGVRACLRAIPIMENAGIRTRVINLSPCKDPDEFLKKYGAEAFSERIKNAENSFFFELRMMEREYDMNDPASKTSFFRAAARRIASFEQEIERENYIQAAAERYQVGFSGLRSMVMAELMKGTPVSDREIKTEDSVRKTSAQKKDERSRKAQRMLLTWIAEYPKFYQTVKMYLTPDDFLGEPDHTIAMQLFEQAENRQINPAAIVDLMEDPDYMRTTSEIFHSGIPDLNEEDQKKAMREALKKVLELSLSNAETSQGTDLAAFQKMIERKKILQRIDKLQIDL